MLVGGEFNPVGSFHEFSKSVANPASIAADSFLFSPRQLNPRLDLRRGELDLIVIALVVDLRLAISYTSQVKFRRVTISSRDGWSTRTARREL